MSAEARQSAYRALLAVACSLAGAAGAEPADADKPPDPALLEYLGSWDAADEEWLLVAGDSVAGDEQADDDDNDDKGDDRDDASQERDDEN